MKDTMQRKWMHWRWGVASASVLLLAACGGGGGGGGGDQDPEESADDEPTASAPGSFETEKVGFETDEEFNPSVGFFTSDDGGLGIRVNGLDADDDGEVDKPEVKNVTIEEGDTTGDSSSGAVVSAAEIETECVDVETGEAGGEGDSFDIGVSLDTTASMGAASGIIADRVAAFATELEDRGLDVRFTGITVGDAYAAKLDESDDETRSTDYGDAISAGTLGQPPEFDSDERPDTGTTLLSATDMETFFAEVATVVDTGRGGGDGTENYLGPVNFLQERVEWRTDAGRFIIGIGDNSAHTPTTFDARFGSIDGSGPWAPPEPAALEDKLADTGTTFYWVGSEFFVDISPRYDMANLAAATGGEFSTLGFCGTEEDCDVDLTELPVVEAVTTKRKTESCTVAVPEGIDKITTRFDVEAADKSWFVTAVHRVAR